MVILGIDPGTANTGYGILAIDRNIRVAECGCIRTPADKEMSERLKIIYQRVSDLIEQYHPDEVAVEQIYFSKNSKTALSIGQARGVIMLSASLAGKKVFDYTPLEIKQAVVGYGRAEKQQVQYMLKDLLHLVKIPSPDDAADALAVALCHYYSRKLKA
ncbi:crossover junction endodeoxyribonuclease RuvC, partial [Candidatus Aerophobetes bacterium Ae_b3a]